MNLRPYIEFKFQWQWDYAGSQSWQFWQFIQIKTCFRPKICFSSFRIKAGSWQQICHYKLYLLCEMYGFAYNFASKCSFEAKNYYFISVVTFSGYDNNKCFPLQKKSITATRKRIVKVKSKLMGISAWICTIFVSYEYKCSEKKYNKAWAPIFFLVVPSTHLI